MVIVRHVNEVATTRNIRRGLVWAVVKESIQHERHTLDAPKHLSRFLIIEDENLLI